MKQSSRARSRRLVAVLAAACGLAAGGCVSGGPGARSAQREPARLVGETSREEIESVRPEWVEQIVMAEPDAKAASALLAVTPADITVYLGTWCSDSRREVSRFWRALDDLPYAPPLALRYVAVDRSKKRPLDPLSGIDLRYVPTFVVTRDGREIGRVIEEAPGGIEGDLLALLEGRASGWISARDDLDPAAAGGWRE